MVRGVFLASVTFLMIGCYGAPNYLPSRSINQIIWTPDQKSLVFTYQNLRKYPPAGMPAPNGVVNVVRGVLYSINADGSGLKEIFDPVVALNRKEDEGLVPAMIGWVGPQLLVRVQDTFYLFNPQSKSAAKKFEYPKLRSYHNCLVQEWLVIDAQQAYGSSVFNLKEPTKSRYIVLQGQNDTVPPQIIACSPDKKHVYYEKTTLVDSKVVERGIAELDPEQALLKNPVQIPIEPPETLKAWRRIVAWLTPETFVYEQVSKDPVTNLVGVNPEIVSFQYPSGERAISQHHFLEKAFTFAVSPDFKQVAFLDLPTSIQIANSDGSQHQTILSSAALPAGEANFVQ